MCHKIGCSPTFTRGLGMTDVSSRNRVPLPPQKITTGSSAARDGDAVFDGADVSRFMTNSLKSDTAPCSLKIRDRSWEIWSTHRPRARSTKHRLPSYGFCDG